MSRAGPAARRIAALAMLLAACLLAAAPAWSQCAMCRGSLESPEGRELARGLAQGIVLLLAVPFGAIGTIAFLVHRAHRRAARRARQGQD